MTPERHLTSRRRRLAFGFSVVLSLALASPIAFAPAVFAEDSERVDVIIGFDRHPESADEAQVRDEGGVVKRRYHLVNAIAANIPASRVQSLESKPRVSSVYRDVKVFAVDGELDAAWGVKRIGSGLVHEAGNTGLDVKVAVIDSGIDYRHLDLDANYAGGYDFVNNDADPMDDNGHGTHVAGTIAGEDNGTGVVGVAPGAKLYALKVLNASGSGSYSNVIAALEWAVDHAVQITNNSYGSSGDPGSLTHSAFDNASAAGILNVAAAGNSGTCGGSGDNVIFPARWESLMAVAATDSTDARACFSSTGPTVEIAAPGVSVNSTWPGGGYAVRSGTSMATPHVAGTAALVIGAGTTGVSALRQRLQETANDLGAAGRDSFYGYGLVDAGEAGVPPAPPGPGVRVALSTDKAGYTSGTDADAVLTAVVKDETGGPISGLASSAFVTTVDSVASGATFTETASLGIYRGNLSLSGLADGSHVAATTVTDSRSLSGTGTATLVIAPPKATTVSVKSIVYVEKKRDLLITLYLQDNFAKPVNGAQVTIFLYRGGSLYAYGSGYTGTDGRLTFRATRAPSGCYATEVADVSAGGLTWDGITPSNGFCK